MLRRVLISVDPQLAINPLNLTTIKTTSDGAWQGDNPLNYAFPLLIVQTVLVLFITRLLAFLLKPLGQPKVIAEIIGGILLGPSGLGRNKDFFQILFPSWSTPILDSVASIGLLFYLFLVGLELDLTTIRKSGKRAFAIALAGIFLPFLFSAGMSLFLRKAINGEDKVAYDQYLMFMGVSLSITAFPVLARILAELKLLTTQMGQTAMAAAAFNDIAAWILLALAVSLAENKSSGGDSKSPLISIWVLISGVIFVAFMMVLVRPIMNWVARQCSRQQDILEEVYICLTLGGVMICGFMTDLIGIHAIFGAFVFGLTIPKEGEFASRVIVRIEDFVSCLLLPLYFASSGLKTDVGKIRGVEAWGLLALVISTACAGKILGTFVVAMLYMIPVRESLVLGLLMNTKGLVDLIVLNIGKEKKVLNDEMFAILVLMALFTTFMTTPTVKVIYQPSRRISPIKNSKHMARILACIHGPQNVPALVNLVNSITSSNKKPSLKLYVMHLFELTDRPSSILMVQRTRKNGFPFINRFYKGQGTSNYQIDAAFKSYNHPNSLKIRHSVAVSALSTMHEDICHVAEDKRVSMIILPYHRQYCRRQDDEGDDTDNSVGHGWIKVNQNVLKTAPCAVAILVDRGLDTKMIRKVCIIFFGGSEDQKALEIGGRMAQHPDISVTLIRFKNFSLDLIEESDEIAVEKFRNSSGLVEYIEKYENNVSKEVMNIGQSGAFDLFVVGKGAEVEDNQELGVIGGILASSENGIAGSVLIIQRNQSYQEQVVNDATMSKMAKDKEFVNANAPV